MTEFSGKLESYIRKRGFTNFYFAKICGVDRTLMQKYISGQRIPKREPTLRLICEKLQMSPDEQRGMQELWKKELLGKDVYEQRTAIREMLEEFGKIVNACARRNPSVFHVEMHVERLSQVTLLYTKEEIADMLWGLMNFEMQRDICDIFMVLQPVYDLLDSVLLHLAQSGKVRIHHLLCIDRKQGKDRGLYNVQILKKILPLVCAEAEYDVRFYYGDVQEQFSSMSAMPNLILTPGFVIQFDREMQRGVVYADREFRAFYQDIYNGMERKTASFLKKHKNVADTIKYYAQQHSCDCSMQFQPFLAYALEPQMLKEVLRPEIAGYGQMIDELYGMLEAWEKKAAEEKVPANTNFFCLEGISDFMDTGRIAEFPPELYYPLSPNWRFCMLETFLKQLENGRIDGYILNWDRVKMDERLVVQLSGREAIYLLGRDRNDSMTALRLSEGGIVNAFADYMEDMKNSPDVKSREETLELVRMELEKYRNMK